jgi:hypothetical protein
MDPTKKAHFTVYSYINDALRKLHINSHNLWNIDSFNKDLASIIKIYLRIKFPSPPTRENQKFFRDKKKNANNSSQRRRSKSKKKFF